jgi:hypothetical protein
MKVVISLLLFSFNLWASEAFELTREELDPEAQEVLIKKPEKYLRHESMIYDFNTDLGIKDQRRFTGGDRNRFSFAGHISGNYEHFQDLLGVEAAYMRRSTRYHQMWYGAQIFRHKTYFDSITKNQVASAQTGTEGSFQRPGNVDNNILGFGLGAGYRFKLLLDFYPTEDVFESIDVFLNGLQLEETYISKTYQGYGLSANYGIHRRTSTSYFYGGKFSYNLATVTRAAIANEKRTDRSLSVGWLSLAFEMGFFY